jgi:fatty acid-binding protein DegV
MQVLTDSSCDLPPDLVDRYGLHVLPNLITLDGRSYRDGVDLSRDEFYRQLPGLRNLPTTAAPSPSLIQELGRRHSGENLLGIFLSSKFRIQNPKSSFVFETCSVYVIFCPQNNDF